MSDLDPNLRDRLVSIAKGIVRFVPIGSVVPETMIELVPNLRFDGMVAFVRVLDAKVQAIRRPPIINGADSRGSDIRTWNRWPSAQLLNSSRPEVPKTGEACHVA